MSIAAAMPICSRRLLASGLGVDATGQLAPPVRGAKLRRGGCRRDRLSVAASQVPYAVPVHHQGAA